MITASDLLIIGFIGGGICFMGILTNICLMIYEEIEKRGGIYDE